MNKKILPIIGGVVGVCFLCTVCGGIMMMAKDDNSTTTSDNASVTTQNQEESTPEDNTQKQEQNNQAEQQDKVMVVDIKEFIAEFDENQLAAEKKYKDKLIQTTGWISNITEGLLGEKYIQIEPTNDSFYIGTWIDCYVKDENQLLSLKNGQQVTFKGMVDDQDFGIIDIKDCEIVQ